MTPRKKSKAQRLTEYAVIDALSHGSRSFYEISQNVYGRGDEIGDAIDRLLKEGKILANTEGEDKHIIETYRLK